MARRPAPKCHFVLGLPSGSLEILTIGILATLGPITLRADLRLKWGQKQSYNSRQQLSNNMSYAICMQGNRKDSWLLVVRSQIGNLTPDPSFGHNLCLSVQMGHASPFQTSKFQELSNDIRNSLIQWVLTFAMALWKLSYTPKSMRCDSRASLLARTLTSPCLGCEPKARVATHFAKVIERLKMMNKYTWS